MMKKVICIVIVSIIISCIISGCGDEALNVNTEETFINTTIVNNATKEYKNDSKQEKATYSRNSLNEAAKALIHSANTALIELEEEGISLPEDLVIISSNKNLDYKLSESFNRDYLIERISHYFAKNTLIDWFIVSNDASCLALVADKNDHSVIGIYKSDYVYKYGLDLNIDNKTYEEVYGMCIESLQNPTINDFDFQEQELYTGNDVRIVAKSMEFDKDGCNVKIYFENNSDKNLSFTARAYGVNGIMTDNNIYDLSTDVSSGCKANATLNIKKSFFDEFNINEIKSIDILFWAYNKDAFFKSFDTGQLQIITSLYDGSKSGINNENIYDKDGLKVGYVNNEGNKYNFVITNETSNLISFDVEEININGYTQSGLDFSLTGVITLNACQSIISIKIDDDFIKINDIAKIDRIDFKLEIQPNEEHRSEYKTDKITYTCP